jgi:hypothetical protein
VVWWFLFAEESFILLDTIVKPRYDEEEAGSDRKVSNWLSRANCFGSNTTIRSIIQYYLIRMYSHLSQTSPKLLWGLIAIQPCPEFQD